MKSWDLFLPQVAPETYGAPKILQIEALRNAAIEFCEKTLVWQEEQDPYPLPNLVMGADPFLDFAFPKGVLVWKILHAHLLGGGAPLVTPRTSQWCDQNFPGWQDGAQLGRPTNVVQISPEQWAPVPAANGGPWQMVLHVAYKPDRTATSGPDFLYNDYYEQIAAGAKARLMAMGKKPWGDTNMAGVYLGVFNEAIRQANTRQAHGFGRGRNRVKAEFR